MAGGFKDTIRLALGWKAGYAGPPAQPPDPAAVGVTAEEDKGLVLRLLFGNEKANPERTLDIAGSAATDSVFLKMHGFSPGPGANQVIWSGRNANRDGQRRIRSSRDNAHYAVSYDLNASSTAELGKLQSKVLRFFEEARVFEEDGQGKPAWLEYRWPDSLASLSAPVFGQLSHYLRVLDAVVPGWPGSLETGALVAGQIEGIGAGFTCRPHSEGLKQQAGKAAGYVALSDYGAVTCAKAITNVITNPAFGHATWNTGWSASDADLHAAQETRPGYTRSLDSAARLTNLSLSVQQYTQTITLTENIYVLSFFARRVDGEAITTADVSGYLDSTSPAISAQQWAGGPWYLCWTTYNCTAGSKACGIEVKVGRDVIIDNVQLIQDTAIYPRPFVAGFRPGCAWAGTAHASTSSNTASDLKWTLDDELVGPYTVATWATAAFSYIDGSDDFYILEYYVDANNYVRLHWDGLAEQFELNGSRDGVAFSDTWSATFSEFQTYHVVLVQEAATTRVYFNGTERITASNAMGLPSGGTLHLGNCEADEAWDGWLDSLRIWAQALTAAQVDTLYDNELPIKNGNGTIGGPPWLWTKDGDNVVDAVDGVISAAAKDNWLILGGVSGDTDASVEWHIDLPTASTPRVVWMGRKAADETLIPYDTLFLDFSGTADSGNSSGDAYETDTTSGSGTDTHDFDATLNENRHARGRVQVLGRFKVTAASIDVQPYFKLGSSDRVLGDTVRVAANANFLLRDLGDIRIDWPQENAPPRLLAGLLCTETEATATTVQLDFLQLLPEPNCRVECEAAAISIASGDTLIIDGLEAWMEDASDSDSQLYRFEHRGDDVTLKPDRYNYVFVVLGEEGQQYTITHTATIEAYITPRWLMAGGAAG